MEKPEEQILHTLLNEEKPVSASNFAKAIWCQSADHRR